MEAPAPVQDTFRPASRLFGTPAPEMVQQPVAAAPQPVVQQYVEPPVQPRMVAPEPAPVQQYAQPQARMEPSLMAQVRAEAESSRMPRVEDFPPVVKAEIEHRAGVAPTAHVEERGPMGLLKRLTSSLARKEEESAHADMAASTPAAQARRPLSPEASLYAPRRGQLDDHGRANPQPRSLHEEDQLEIPAFLRRQSN